MLSIPGVDVEKVSRWGKPFLKLVQNAKRRYEEMVAQEHQPQDPNHINVVVLSSDEEDHMQQKPDEFDELDDLESDFEPQDTHSPYFHPPSEVVNQNARRESRFLS